MTADAWTPPDDPDPSEILNSTLHDKRDGRYAEALAKHLWYHHHANRLDRSQGAVRLSFALGYWMDLAAVYPPAKEAFLQTRDETEARFRDQPDFESFHELAAFNRFLQDGLRTADLFTNVAANDHHTASKLYHVAEAYLVAAGRFRECAAFLEPEKRIEREAELYQLERSFEESRPASKYPVPKRARERFMGDVATLVGLLVLNERNEEARQVRDRALEVVDDEDFRTMLDAAMTGHLPQGLFG